MFSRFVCWAGGQMRTRTGPIALETQRNRFQLRMSIGQDRETHLEALPNTDELKTKTR